MKVVVTGGAGYVGWSLVHALLPRDEVSEVVVLDNFRRGNFALMLGERSQHSAKLRVRRDDILNSRGLRKHLLGAEVVCHLAAVVRTPFSTDSPHEFDQINHWGTAEVCYAIEDLGVPRLVYLSSGAVYGQGNGEFSTGSPTSPGSAYGESKLAGERQVQRLSKKTHTVVIRPGTVYGLNPCVRFDTAVNKFCLNIVLGRALHIFGDGQQRRPLVYIEAIAELLMRATLGNLAAGVFNAVDHNPTIMEIVTSLRSLAPEAEFVFVNQNQGMGSLSLAADPQFGAYNHNSPLIVEGLRRILAGLGCATSRST